MFLKHLTVHQRNTRFLFETTTLCSVICRTFQLVVRTAFPQNIPSLANFLEANLCRGLTIYSIVLSRA